MGIIVSVVMITYNHEKFIREAIKGVLMQNCNFEFELIIANDASTDNSNQIIEEIINNNQFNEKIKYFYHEQNIGMMQNFLFALEQCNRKYIAFCEGDDYWTDPFKLQKQVDFLENNNYYSGCCHNVIIKDQRNGTEREMWKLENQIDLKLETLALGNRISTSSLLFRSNIKIINFIRSFIDMPVGDYILNLYISSLGPIRYFSFLGGIYNVHEGGVWSTKFDNNNSAIEKYEAFDAMLVKLIKVFPRELNNNFQNQRYHLYDRLCFHYLENKNYNKIRKSSCFLLINIKYYQGNFVRRLIWLFMCILFPRILCKIRNL